MTLKKKIVIGILTIICGVMLVFAFEIFTMANSGNLMPLMEDSIGKTTLEIKEYSPELLQFIFTPIKVISALLFSFTIGILVLLYGPFKKNMKWATYSIFTPLMIWLILAILIYSSQPSAPWQIWLILFVLAFIALILTLTEKNKST